MTADHLSWWESRYLSLSAFHIRTPLLFLSPCLPFLPPPPPLLLYFLVCLPFPSPSFLFHLFFSRISSCSFYRLSPSPHRSHTMHGPHSSLMLHFTHTTLCAPFFHTSYSPCNTRLLSLHTVHTPCLIHYIPLPVYHTLQATTNNILLLRSYHIHNIPLSISHMYCTLCTFLLVRDLICILNFFTHISYATVP
jgi:hypothetical protein